MVVQRLRVKFGRKGPPSYISHLDMMRMWQRAFRRAGIPVAYSTGQIHRPKFSLGAPLPVGVTADGDLMDVYLKRRMSPFYFLKQLTPQLPRGLEVSEAEDVPIDSPSLQSQVGEAEYEVVVSGGVNLARLQDAIASFLEQTSFPWEHQRDKEVRKYDLRQQVHELWAKEGSDGEAKIGMLLKCDPSGSGRPEQVVAALGVETDLETINRSRLILAPRPRNSTIRK